MTNRFSTKNFITQSHTFNFLFTRTFSWNAHLSFSKINNKLLNEVSSNPFLEHIPSTYIQSIGKAVNIHFNILELRSAMFRERIKANIPNGKYTVFIKIRYNINSFFMLGNQFGFDFDFDNKINDLLSILLSRLEDAFEDYNLTDESIVYIQISFRRLDKRVLSKLYLDSGSTNMPKTEVINTNKMLSIPVSIAESSIGKPLETTIENNQITDIILHFNNSRINFLDVIKKKAQLIRNKHIDQITEFDSTFKFYLLKDVSYYILAVKNIDNSSLDKIRYSLDGVVVNCVTDQLLDNNLVRRTIGTKEILLNNDKVFMKSQEIKLKTIKKPENKVLFVSDPNIGVIDTETYLSHDNIYKIYALGFKTNLEECPKTYYIDKSNLDSDAIVLSMIDELLKSKYENITFYCHNLSGYDVVFILRVLTRYNDNNKDQYKISTILRDDKIISLKVTKNKHTLNIIDSFCMLTDSLSNLGKSFEVNVLKTKFPYKFITEDHLFYKGPTPDIRYYEDITENQYSKLYKTNWYLYEETIKYLNNDLLSLYEVLVKANKQLFMDYDVNMTKNLTVSGLATRIYLKDYYNDNIPVISKASIYNDIRQAYYGGITEVYKPYGENLFYYDVNSLYPYVALQDMPGSNCSKLEFFTDKTDLSNLFGFFYCDVENTEDNYLGLLPLRTPTGIMMPVGKWKGWYFSEELKFAQENGFKIKVVKGYNFNREKNVFKDYIHKVYSIKANPTNKTQKSIAKSLLNNLLGRFGIMLDKAVTELMSNETFSKLSLMYKITSYKEVSNDKILVSYVPRLDFDVITSHKLDFIKVVNANKDQEIQSLSITSIPISAAVTAYGRIHISKIKLDILKSGGNIYYSDTDSIVTDKKLPDSMIHPTEIGKLKLEHEIQKGIFISGKIYWFVDSNFNVIKKAKGIKSSFLSYHDYIKLMNNKNIDTAVKKQSKIDWEQGHVTIKTNKNVTINSDSYTKRIKIYKDRKWIDTKPVHINHLDTSLIIYENNWCLVPFSNKKNNTKLVRLNPYLKSLQFTSNKNFIYLKFLWGYMSLFIVLPISYLAYMTVTEYEDDKAVVETENSVINSPNTPNTITEILVKDTHEIASNDDETDSSNDTITPSNHVDELRVLVDESSESIANSTETLYGGFLKKLDEIKELLNKNSVTEVDERTTSSRPSTIYTESSISSSANNTQNTSPSVSFSDNDEIISQNKFSPKTLNYLEDEIQRNQSNINELESVCTKDTIDSVKENLIDERRYLLDQKSRHLRSILEEAKNTPLSDIDNDELSEDITKLKKDADQLDKIYQEVKHRKLNEDQPDDNSYNK